MMKRALVLLMLIAMGQSTLSYSQTVTIDSIKTCTGEDTLFVPIRVIDFNNIGAITLYIDFDTTVLKFDTIINVNSKLSGTIANKIPNKQKIGIVWSATSAGADVGVGTFCDLRFIVKKNGATTLSFDAASEVADFNADILNVIFKNGSVSVNVLPVVSFTGLMSNYCLSSSGDLLTGIPAGGQFSGAGMNGTVFNPSLAGIGVHTITYTYTDAAGCSDSVSATTTVSQNSVITITPSNPALCIGSSVTLTAQGGTTYLWSNGETTASITVSPGATTMYTVTGTDTTPGCQQDTATTTVTVNSLPIVTVNVSANTVPGPDTTWVIRNAGLTFNPPSITIAYGDSVRFQIGGSHDAVEVSQATWNANGNTPLVGGFSTPFGGGLISPSQLGVGTHYYVCTPHAGMGMKGKIIVTPSAAVCAGTSVTLSGSGASIYTWSHGAIDGIGFIPTSTNTYTVTGTDANGCTNTQSVKVTVVPNPVVTITPSSSSICSGSSVTLTASGATTYLWSNGETTASIIGSPTSTTAYTVTGSAGGCQDTATATVTVNPNPTIDITPSNPTICNGGSVTLTASGATTYVWNNGEITPSIIVSPTSTTTYSVTGTDANGCTNTQSVEVAINQNLVVSITPANPAICIGSSTTLTANGAATYVWNTGETTPSIVVSPTSTNAYTVTGTSSSCQDTATTIVTVNPLPIVTVNVSANTVPRPDTTWVIRNAALTFNPPSITIAYGDSVRFQIGGSHNAMEVSQATWNANGNTPLAGGFSTPFGGGLISPSQLGVGTHYYVCTPHAGMGMKGIIVVTPSSAVCAGTSITLSGGGASTYTWSHGVVDGVGFVPTATTTYTVTGTDANGCSNTQSVKVTVIPNPVVTITPSNPAICSGTSTTLTATGASTYLWSNGETTASIIVFPTSTAIYTVIGTNGNSCQGTATTTVTVNPNPTVSITPANSTICNGSSVTLTANGASTYLWSNGETTASIIVSPTSTTTYSVTGMDANGCINTQSVEVTVNTNLVVTITPANPAICSGESVALTASGASAYLWSNGETTPSIIVSPTSTTTYSVTGISGNNCQDTAATTVTVDPNPVINITPANPSICNGNSVTLTAQGASTYLWSNGETTTSIIVSPTSSISYIATGTLGNCTATQTTVVTVNPNPPVSILPVNPSICTGSSVTLTASGVSAYLWSNGEITASIIVSPTSTTTYSVTGTDANGCTGAQFVEVTVSQNLLVTITPDNPSICSGSSAILTATGATTYLWSNGETTASIIVSPTSTTAYTVTGSTGDCQDTAAATVTVNPTPTISITPSNPTICNGGSVTLTASGATTYLWSNGETTPSIIVSPTLTTTYSVTGTDANGCSNTQSVEVTVNTNLVVTITPANPAICSGESVTLTASGASTYSWNTGQTTSSIIVSPTVTATYSVTGMLGTCSATQTAQVAIIQNPVITITPSDTTLCSGGAVTLTVQGASTYLWSTGETTASITVSPVSTTIYTVTGANTNGCIASQSVQVTINQNPIITITPDSTTICSGSSVTLTAQGASTYSWSTGQTTASIVVSPASTTTYSVTGTLGTCSSTQTAQVVVNQNLLVTITPDNTTICSGNSVTLTAHGASSYIWNTGATTQTIIVSPSSTTNYTVIGTSGNSCQDTAAATVTVNPLPVVTASISAATIPAPDTTWTIRNTGLTFNPPSTTIAYGDSVRFQIGGSHDAVEVSQATWNANGNTPLPGGFSTPFGGGFVTPAHLTVGTHYYVCTPHAGMGMKGIIIVTPSSAVCAGTSVTLSGGGASTYTWSHGVIDGIGFIPTSTNTYTVTGTDANGCSSTQSVKVTVVPNPVVTITPSSSTVCSGESVTLTANGASTYLWSTGQTTASIVVSPDSTTIYTVTGTNASGCTTTQSIQIAVNQNLVVTITPANSAICSGESVTLTASGASTYVWNNGQTTSSIIVSPTSTIVYTVTGTLGNCTATQTTVVTVNPNPTVSILPANPTICNGSTVTLTANGASSYTWNTGATTQSIIVSPSSTTTYSVIGANGACTAAKSVQVMVNPTPVVSITPANPKICKGGSATLTASGASTYLWSTGQTTSSIIVSPAVTTTYTVTGKNAGGCQGTATTTVTVSPSTVTVDAGPNKNVYVGYTPLSCTNLSATSIGGGTPGYSLLWSTGATTNSINVCPVINTKYSVTVTDSKGCKAKDSVQVCAKDVRCQTNKVRLCGTFTLFGQVIGQQTYCVPQATATILLSLNGPIASWKLGACGMSTACGFGSKTELADKNADFGEEHLTAQEYALIYGNPSVTLYPNPSSNTSFVNVEMLNVPDKTVLVTVTDIMGQVVLNQQVTVNDHSVKKQLHFDSALTRGTYIVSVITEGTVITEKLIVQ